MAAAASVIPVRVAVRIRPVSDKERAEGCQTIVGLVDENPGQIRFQQTEKAFTYDYAFGPEDDQEPVYDGAVKDIIKQLFKGYNVTVLAYGQTGSGKTHSMGTSAAPGDADGDQRGVIPRAIGDIFKKMEELRGQYQFEVKVSFLELYKEQLFDLLSTKSTRKEDCIIDIREDPREGIKMVGLEETCVASLAESLRQLEHGSLKRVTAATAMNATSSRSHAIFTLTLKMDARDGADGGVTVSKFHMVDLAGSERQKKTKATGERLKEGIDINKGLLCLGNVISALGEKSGDRGFVPYRDSKLTRILQDSLGGNSHTLMIACVSPADTNFDETMSTLRYADRARKIKNKPIINTKDEESGRLREENRQLRAQLLALESGGGGGAKAGAEAERALRRENSELTNALVAVQEEMAHMNEKQLLTESSHDLLKTRLLELATEAERGCDAAAAVDDAAPVLAALAAKARAVLSDFRSLERTLQDHEISRHERPADDASALGDADAAADMDDAEFVASQAKKTSHLTAQLQDLNRLLVQKEQLASDMTQNDEKLKEMRHQYEDSIQKLEEEIENLQKEKDSLCGKKEGDTTSKISEQRRKRIQDLEQQMQDLRRKVLAQQKAIKANEKNEAKIKKLDEEIRGMKQAKVKLIRQQKDEFERVRAWKATKENEVAKLKQNERKQQSKVVKMETLHAKQQNFMRRKIEETQAVNKRLRDAVEKQKAAKAQRAAAASGRTAAANVGAGPRIRNWIQDEIDVAVGIKEAEATRQQRIKERTELTAAIAAHERDFKRRMRETFAPAEVKEANDKLSQLKVELESRSEQINTLQRQLLAAEDGDSSGAKDSVIARWESLQTMTEAKLALEYLFDKASESSAAHTLVRNESATLRAQYAELVMAQERLEAQVVELKIEHESELVHAEREREAKVFSLLQQMTMAPPAADDGTPGIDAQEQQRMIRLQAEEIAKMTDIHEELYRMSAECDRLKREKARHDSGATSPTTAVPPVLSLTAPSGDKMKPPTGGEKIATYAGATSDDEEDRESEVDSSEFEEDNDADPDWQNTPLYKRMRKLKAEQSVVAAAATTDDAASKRKLGLHPSKSTGASKRASAASKRASDGGGSDEENGPPQAKRSWGSGPCRCKTGCNSNRCVCRKSGRLCGVVSGCRCDPSGCRNADGARDATVTSTTAASASALADRTNDTACTADLLDDTYDLSVLKPLREEDEADPSSSSLRPAAAAVAAAHVTAAGQLVPATTTPTGDHDGGRRSFFKSPLANNDPVYSSSEDLFKTPMTRKQPYFKSPLEEEN